MIKIIKIIKTIKESNPYKLIVIIELSLLVGISLAYFTVKIPVLITKFLSQTAEFVSMRNSLIKQQEIVKSLQFDRIRYEHTIKILLSLQDYINAKEIIPNNLKEISSAGYLDSMQEFNDPEWETEYYYQKRNNDFIFCVYMSDRIKGVNTEECPLNPAKKAEPMNRLDKNLSANISDSLYLNNFNERLTFSVIWGLWVGLFVSLIYYFIARTLVDPAPFEDSKKID